MTTLAKWYEIAAETNLPLVDIPEDPDELALVISMKMHNPSQWRLDIDEYLEISGSKAAAALLRLADEGLEINTDNEGGLLSADLTFQVDSNKAARASRFINRSRVYVTGFSDITKVPPEFESLIKSKRDIKRTKKGFLRALNLTLDSAGEAKEYAEYLKSQGLKAEIPMFSNSYRLTRCEPVAGQPGRFWLTANLARKITIPGKKKDRQILSMIDAKKGLQQLLASFLAPEELVENVTANEWPGICQEVAQQITSHLGLLDSERVARDKVEFPTVETRDPKARMQEYLKAVDTLVSDLRPLERKTARELKPKKYAADDPKGATLRISDERWSRLLRNAGPPKPLTLFYVKSNTVRIFRGEVGLPTDVPKNSRHSPPEQWRSYRPWETPSMAIQGLKQKSGPHKGRLKDANPSASGPRATTKLTQYYAAIEMDLDDPTVKEAFAHRDESGRGRNLPLNLSPVALHEDKLTKKQRRINAEDLMYGLEFDRQRIEPVLNSSRYRILWARRVRRGDDLYLQLTLGIPVPDLVMAPNILGIAFGLDASAYWCLLDSDGEVRDRGRIAPNEQMTRFLAEKKRLENEQKKGRYIGGKKFDRKLETIAHRNCDLLIQMCHERQADLAVEDIAWVQKSSPDSKQNVLFTALNFGQIPKILKYKSRYSGKSVWLCSGYVTGHTCPSCGALSRGKAKEGEERKTFWKDGKLHCRTCGYAGVPEGGYKAFVAAQNLHRHRLEKKRKEANTQ